MSLTWADNLVIDFEIAGTSTHIVSGYDAELSRLTHDLTDLGTLVSEMVEDAMQAFKGRDSLKAQQVIDRDQEANALQFKVDEAVQRIIALRNPVAQDLRSIISATRIASDLERVGDLAEGIARRAMIINEEKRIDIAKSVHRMGKQVRKQLAGALDTLLKSDAIGSGQFAGRRRNRRVPLVHIALNHKANVTKITTPAITAMIV